MENHGVFGSPPKELAAVPAGATQYSPLEPGSRNLEDAPPDSLPAFTMLASPGTIERRYHLALALRSLRPGAPLLALAPKDKGGSRLAKELREFGLEVEEEARSHHRICRAVKPAVAPNLAETLAEGAARFDQTLGAWTQPGVFSWNRLDPGTKLLLEHLPALAGRGADLGGGLGFLTRAVLESPRVIFAEIDRRALDCARKNIASPRVDFRWLDLRQSRHLETGLDFVVSNPPFHDGGHEDQGLGQIFIRQAAYLLRPGGVCWLVANKHLAYEKELKSLFTGLQPVVETGGYKIYEAHR